MDKLPPSPQIFKKYLFSIISIPFTIITIITYFGLYTNFPSFITNLSMYLHIFVCIFLIFRFNPIYSFGNKNFTYLDRQIAFNAGMFILFTNTNLLKGITQIIFPSSHQQ